MSFEHLILEKRDDAVGVITLNRPKVYNALCMPLVRELGIALDDLEADDNIRAIVITGNEKAFAAGADIVEMKDMGMVEAYKTNFVTDGWERITTCDKPVIAAVAGFALGGGCEMAMMCDFIIAADNAKFGQPEVTIGTIPGAGGTQRLTRLVGKAKAMDMVLTGRNMGAEEAERSGLVARVVPLENLMEEALKAAAKIASLSQPVVRIAKESVDTALETTLAQGVKVERQLLYATFALDDKIEGMNAFAEKRKPNYQHK